MQRIPQAKGCGGEAVNCPLCKEQSVQDLKDHFKRFHTLKELEQLVVEDKKRGTPDVEIGKKYGITFKQLEDIIRRSTGLSLGSFKRKKIKSLQPKDFKEETTTVWSFKQRGNWATHSGAYRGNWSPYIPRNVILKYSKEGETVLDCFCGAGTTAIEAKLLGRGCIAFDINERAIEMARENLDFSVDGLFDRTFEPELLVADARDMSFIPDESIDLICTHPPYADIIHYTDHKEGDLSFCGVSEFLEEMKKVAKECYRVLKPGRQCAVLIGDMRKNRYVVPLGFELINVFLNAGFKLRELVIKRQHNCKTTGFWYKRSIEYNFLLLAHEYLPIFEKPVREQLKIQEEEVEYGNLICIKDKVSTKRKLEQQETTTVWILPEKDFEKVLNKNVLERYGKKGSIIISARTSQGQEKISDLKFNRYELVFIKSPLLRDNIPLNNLKKYIEKILFLISSYVKERKDKGYIVIQTKDVRIGRYIEPMAKKIIDKTVSVKAIKLKEIIIVTTESKKENYPLKENLETTHQYLLVYEVSE